MNWQSIRLELARTEGFPDGSASRAYLLHLPLDPHGLIDGRALRRAPARATVRRFWPNERDKAGYVIRTPQGWAFSYEPGEADDEAIFHLESHRLLIGDCVTLTEPDGSRLPFRVAGLRALG